MTKCWYINWGKVAKLLKEICIKYPEYTIYKS